MSAQDLRPLLAAYPVVAEIPVAWGDMDYFRHVNNTAFFRYLETARIAYLERIGFAEELERDRIGPILASTHCRFRRALAYPDTVYVGARTVEVGDDRFTMEYLLASEQLGAAAAEGGGVVVAFDYARGVKTRIPEQVRQAIERLEAGSREGALVTSAPEARKGSARRTGEGA